MAAHSNTKNSQKTISYNNVDAFFTDRGRDDTTGHFENGNTFAPALIYGSVDGIKGQTLVAVAFSGSLAGSIKRAIGKIKPCIMTYDAKERGIFSYALPQKAKKSDYVCLYKSKNRQKRKNSRNRGSTNVETVLISTGTLERLMRNPNNVFTHKFPSQAQEILQGEFNKLKRADNLVLKGGKKEPRKRTERKPYDHPHKKVTIGDKIPGLREILKKIPQEESPKVTDNEAQPSMSFLNIPAGAQPVTEAFGIKGHVKGIEQEVTTAVVVPIQGRNKHIVERTFGQLKTFKIQSTAVASDPDLQAYAARNAHKINASRIIIGQDGTHLGIVLTATDYAKVSSYDLGVPPNLKREVTKTVNLIEHASFAPKTKRQVTEPKTVKKPDTVRPRASVVPKTISVGDDLSMEKGNPNAVPAARALPYQLDFDDIKNLGPAVDAFRPINADNGQSFIPVTINAGPSRSLNKRTLAGAFVSKELALKLLDGTGISVADSATTFAITNNACATLEPHVLDFNHVIGVKTQVGRKNTPRDFMFFPLALVYALKVTRRLSQNDISVTQNLGQQIKESIKTHATRKGISDTPRTILTAFKGFVGQYGSAKVGKQNENDAYHVVSSSRPKKSRAGSEHRDPAVRRRKSRKEVAGPAKQSSQLMFEKPLSGSGLNGTTDRTAASAWPSFERAQKSLLIAFTQVAGRDGAQETVKFEQSKFGIDLKTMNPLDEVLHASAPTYVALPNTNSQFAILKEIFNRLRDEPEVVMEDKMSGTKLLFKKTGLEL
jgi:hypothetical protein